MNVPFPILLALGLLTALVLLHSLILMGVLRMIAQLYRATLPDSDPITDPADRDAPSFSARTLGGSTIDTMSLKGRLTALLFVTPSCTSCEATLEDLEAVKARAAGNVVLVCWGEVAECSSLADRFRPIDIIHDRDQLVRKAFGVTRTPTAVLIGADSRIRSYGRPVRDDLREVVNQDPIGAVETGMDEAGSALNGMAMR